jgi:putative ABC transport system permease protein
MLTLKLILNNTLHHKLRTVLTIVGIAIAVGGFGFVRTIVTAWNAGVDASAANRMITRHAVSFIFPLPLSYREHLLKTPGVSEVSFANWFGGVYKDPSEFKNFFPRMAIDPDTYFSLYSEYIIDEAQLATFKQERNACIVGRKIAEEHGFKIGDVIPLDGDIYPGTWEFVIRGIYRGKDKTADETQMLFHWRSLDERLRAEMPGRAGNVGWYILKVNKPGDMPVVAQTIDENYRNSRASTKTETEKEFQQSFVSMSSAIVNSIEVSSYIIIGVLLLILANTIAMGARERTREYAVFKTLGFSPSRIGSMIVGEALLLAMIGAGIGIPFIYNGAFALTSAFPTWFPIVNVQTSTLVMAVSAPFVAALISALLPVIRAANLRIADGLRYVG